MSVRLQYQPQQPQQKKKTNSETAVKGDKHRSRQFRFKAPRSSFGILVVRKFDDMAIVSSNIETRQIVIELYEI